MLKTDITKSFLVWSLLLVFNVILALVVVFLLLINIPNAYPLIGLIIVYGLQLYIFRYSKNKLFALIFLLFLTIWLMADTTGASAVSLKCAPELNRLPLESRDIAKIREEAENFDSCSLSAIDYLVYGLLKN